MENIITCDEVMKVASVAKIEITDEEAGRFAEQLSSILEGAKGLHSVDVSNLDPLINPLDGRNIPYRDDVMVQILTQEEVLRPAKNKEHGHFKVPRTIDG